MTLVDTIARRFDPRPDVPLERITVDRFLAMIDAGIYREGKGLELIDGLVVRNDADRGQAVHNQRHFLGVTKVGRLDRNLEPTAAYMQVQLPLALGNADEPEPDGAIIRAPFERYTTRKPGAADVAVVIEVSDTSLRFDRREKLTSYAVAGIPQYVIVNLVDDVVEVRADPDPVAGTYGEPTLVGRDGTVTLDLFDGQTLAVAAADLLP